MSCCSLNSLPSRTPPFSPPGVRGCHQVPSCISLGPLRTTPTSGISGPFAGFSAPDHEMVPH